MGCHPSTYFIKFLMTQQRPEAKDDEWVSWTLTQFLFPPIDAKYLRVLRDWVVKRTPQDFQPYNRFHRPSVKFLRDEGIYSLHNPDEAAKNAAAITTNLRSRDPIQQLIMGRVEAKEIAKKINARFGEFHTAADIEAYKQYYWNVDLMKMEDWIALYGEQDGEARKAMSILQVGPAMALHMTGFQQQVESKVVLKEMMEAVYFDFRHWKAQPPSRDRTNAFATLAKSAQTLDQGLSEANNALRESLRAFEKFRMMHADGKVPGIRELAPEGNFTGSGARLIEGKVADDEEPKSAKGGG